MAQTSPELTGPRPVGDGPLERPLAESDLGEPGPSERLAFEITRLLGDPQGVVVLRPRADRVAAIPRELARESHHASLEVLEPRAPSRVERLRDDRFCLVSTFE